MSIYKINDTTLTGIADAIRRKTGSSDLMYVSDMASNIDAIPAISGNGPIKELLEGTSKFTIVCPEATKIQSYALYAN
jgi:hypothetical protein